jgi:RNA polymerase-associated protein
MPADPVQRARARLLLLNFEREVFIHIDALEKQDAKKVDKARAVVRDQLSQLAPVVAKSKYMMGEDFTMIDVALAPLLWRLDHYGIEMPKAAAPVLKYAERIFARPAFFEALTPSEKVMRR